MVDVTGLIRFSMISLIVIADVTGTLPQLDCDKTWPP